MNPDPSTARRRLLQALALACLPLPAAARPAPLLLARELGPDADPSRYLVSEKFDGVRALWDGEQLRFRSGRVVSAPPWFLARLPARPLDGELWLAHGRFEALAAAVRRERPQDAEWQALKYQVFELPAAPGSFEQRAALIEKAVALANWPQLVAVQQFRVADRPALQRRLDEVVNAGGEGLMLHRADAPFHTGRSDALLKLKPLNDAEAVVTAQVAGHGKNADRLGALQVQMPQGRRFLIGTGFSDAERSAPPPVGSTVTYTYRGLTAGGVPRFASFLRSHTDF
jgi:DNA ligase-1